MRSTDNVDAVFVPDDLRALALEEGAHAVVAQRLGFCVTAVEVEDLDGYTFIAKFDQAPPGARLCVLMAGTEAQCELLGAEMPTRPIENSDASRIADVLLRIDRAGWSSALAQARGLARRMVRVHRGAIAAVASALLERCAVAGEPRARLDGDALAALLDADGSGILRRAAV